MARITIGVMRGSSGSTQVVDASVAELAVSERPSIVFTSDPRDIEMLVKSAGFSCRKS